MKLPLKNLLLVVLLLAVAGASAYLPRAVGNAAIAAAIAFLLVVGVQLWRGRWIDLIARDDEAKSRVRDAGERLSVGRAYGAIVIVVALVMLALLLAFRVFA